MNLMTTMIIILRPRLLKPTMKIRQKSIYNPWTRLLKTMMECAPWNLESIQTRLSTRLVQEKLGRMTHARGDCGVEPVFFDWIRIGMFSKM